MWYFYLCIYHGNKPNEGKYTSPMDPEGFFIYLWLIYGGEFIDPSLPVIAPEICVFG